MDRRISNPTSLTVKKVTFSPVSSLTVHPHVIYMHSRALSDMIIDKHTVILKGNAHEISADVIGVLEETHTRGRYALTEREGPFRMSPSAHQRVIDIYFTDGTGAHMDGEVAAGGSSSGGAADDQTMIDLGADILKMWIDFDYAPLDSYSNLVTEVGYDVSYVQNRFPGTATLFWTMSAGDFVLADVGETKGIAGGPNASWAYATDSNVVDITAPCTLFYIFKVPPTTSAQTIIQMPGSMFRNQIKDNALQYRSVNATWTSLNVTNFLSSHWYYVECRCHDTDGDTVANFSWRIIKLTDPTVEMTEQTDGNVLSATWYDGWKIRAPNDHFSVTLGPMILIEGGNSTKRDTGRDWMLAKYSSATVEEAPAAAEPATFFAQLNIRTK